MITSVNSVVTPRTLILTGMFVLGAVTGNALKAHSTDEPATAIENRLEGPSADVFEFTTEDNDTVKFNVNDNIKTVKSQFKTLMKSIMVENPWKYRTSGVNYDEYLAIGAFLNEASESKDPKVKEWANKKLRDLEQLTSSEYNTKTKNKEMGKSNALIKKYDAEVAKYQEGGANIRSFFDFVLYKDDYQRLYDNNSIKLKYAERDRAYYRALNLLEQYDVLSSAATKKFNNGQGKRVK